MDLSLLEEQSLAAIQVQALNFITFSNAELVKLLKEKEANNPVIKLSSRNNIYETSHVSAYAEEKSDKYYQYYQSLPEKKESLCDVLENQLHLTKTSKAEEEIGLLIIHSLDKNGFLTFDKDELLENIDLSESDKNRLYFKMCDLISTFEPEGCATKDAFESLKKQYVLKIGLDGDALLGYNLINKKDFESFSKGAVNHLSKKYDTSIKKIKDAFDTIKNELTPYPGSSYSNESIHYTQADVISKN